MVFARGVAVFGEPHRNQAELLSPVSQVVDSLNPGALAGIQIRQAVPNHGRPDMVEGDRLGDVGRGVVDHHRLSALGVPASEGRPQRSCLVEHLLEERHGQKSRIQIGALRLDLQPRHGQPGRQCRGNRSRRFLLGLREQKGGKAEIPVGRLRFLHLSGKVLRRNAQAGGNCLDKGGSITMVDGSFHPGLTRQVTLTTALRVRELAFAQDLVRVCTGCSSAGRRTTAETVPSSLGRLIGFSKNPSIRSRPSPDPVQLTSLVPEMM